ncbi:MAG: hypothetical protein HYX85_02105 [Chloroflexi bacterium]|nr:hypothetical protein [Chloroflexota bacterium]
MNWSAVIGNGLFILLIIGLGILIFYFRSQRRPERTRLDMMRNLFMAVRLNLALIGYLNRQRKPKMFEVVSWQANRDRLGFLDEQTQKSLSEAFTLADDYNRRMKTARKQKAEDPLAGIDLEKLKEPLAKSRQGMENYFQAMYGTKEPPPPRPPGLSDMLFGSRGD